MAGDDGSVDALNRARRVPVGRDHQLCRVAVESVSPAPARLRELSRGVPRHSFPQRNPPVVRRVRTCMRPFASRFAGAMARRRHLASPPSPPSVADIAIFWGGLTLHSGRGGHCRPAVGRVVLAPFWLVDLGTLAAVEPPLLCPFWNYRTSVATSPCPGSPGSAGTSAGSWGAGPLARPRGDRGAGTPCRAEQVGDLVVAVDARDCAARPARLAPGHASTASSDTPATRRLLTRSRVPESSDGRRPDRDRSCPGTGQRRRDVQYWRFRGPPCRIP